VYGNFTFSAYTTNLNQVFFSSGTRGRGRPERERENQLTKVYLEKVEVVVAVVVVVVGVVRKGDELLMEYSFT